MTTHIQVAGRPVAHYLRLASMALAALLIAAASPLAAQTETFEEAASVVVVEVPVQVVDADGAPVRGLARENFEILDDGKPREIVAFETFDRAGPAAARGQVTSAARRHFLLLFDLSFSDPTAILRAREAASGVLGHLHPTDLVAVGTFSLLRGTQLLLSFTSDRRQVDLAIETLGAAQLVDKSPDPLGLLLSSNFREAGSVPQPGLPAEGRGAETREGREEMIRQYLEEVETSSKRSDRESQAARVQGYVRSMADLAGLMRAVEGRKYVVLLSEGFDSRLLTGEGGTDEDRNRAIESGELWSVDTEEMFGSGRLQNSLEQMLEEFRRADCAIQAVDIGGLRDAGEGVAAAAGQEGLFAMARGTGGELYRNFNDLGQAMEKLLERTSVTYVLAFQPPDLPPDGKYRKLKVRLRNVPRGARIVHRPGYFAPAPDGEPHDGKNQAERERLEVAAELLGGREGGAIRVGVLGVPVAVAGDRPALPVLVEIDGSTLLAGAGSGETAVELYVYALDAGGGVGDYLFQTLGLDLAKVGERVQQGGVKFYGQLDVDPGIYTLRVLVRNGRTGASGLATATVEVPSFAAGELAVLPPLLPEMSFDRWLMVRQTPAAGDRQIPYPFLLGEGQSFVPAAEPTLATGLPARLGVFAYNLGGEEVTLNAQVLNAAGDVVLGRQLAVIQRYEAGESGPTRLMSALELSAVPPGDYTLSVGVFAGASGKRAFASLPIRVVPGPAGTEPALAAEVEPAGAPSGEPGAPAPGPDEPLVPAGKEAERLAAIRAAYREALAKLSGGFQQEAATALTGIERAEAKASEDVLLELLRRAELEVARQLADEDPSALIPVMLLHEGTYLTYRERDERIVARHGREMVRELAELYVRSGGEPTSVAASVFTSLGGSLQQAGLTTSANSLFERALDLDRANEGALLSLAVYYEKVGLYERAVSYLERLTEARPGIGEAWLRLGVNLQRLGKREEARRWLAQARGPEAGPWVRSLAYQELASTSIAEQDLAGAEALLREGLDQLPGDQRLILQLCLVLDRRGRAAAARALLEGLEPEAPGEDLSPRYLYNRWPIHVIETGRRELASTAVARLPVLARVISGLARTEWSR